MTSAMGKEPLIQQNGPTSTRDLADLARAGYEILRKPFTHVDFEVHHTIDRPGYLHDILCNRMPMSSADIWAGSAITETLVSAANGVGLIIATNTGVEAQPFVREPPNSSVDDLVLDEPRRRIFRGASQPNPTFLFESALTYEGIISIELAPRSVKFHQSIALRDLVREISRTAAEVARAPLLFLQAPAQVPAQSFTGEDVRSAKMTVTRRSSSLAVRFAIALSQPSSQLRLELTDILRRYCIERGFGLWLADSRIGYRSGNWFQICAHAADLPRRARRERASTADLHAVEACLPITLVGPARISSTQAIASFLCQFSDVGIISASITTLDDLLFLHFQLSFGNVGRSALREVNRRLAAHDSWAMSPSDTLIKIREVLLPNSEEHSGHVLAGELAKHAGDYQTMLGPMLGCTVPDSSRRLAVWVSWQADGTVADLATPLKELFAASSALGLGPADSRAQDSQVAMPALEMPNIEYLICRDIGNSILRGRGKLSVLEADILKLFGSGDRETAASRLCLNLEKAWRTAVRRGSVRGVGELTVSWRECWLGHWTSPI